MDCWQSDGSATLLLAGGTLNFSSRLARPTPLVRRLGVELNRSGWTGKPAQMDQTNEDMGDNLNQRPRTMRKMSLALVALICGSLLVGAAVDHGGEPAPALPPLQLLPGLSASLWAAEPWLENPVAFSFDDRGRCYIAETHRWAVSIFDITKKTPWLESDLSFRTVEDRERFLTATYATNLDILTRDSERVRWVEDRSGKGKVDAGGILATDFRKVTSGTAAGVLAIGEDVWFASIPDLWRLHSSSASGEADRRTLLHTGYGVHIGVSGHDLHGLKMGPDGRLYFSIGDRGFNLGPSGPPQALKRPGWNFSFEQPDTGAVLRCDPDGSHLEVFAIGLRNPQELTFDALGNLWAGDNDTAGADDSRLLHVVEGGDYGWRCSYQHQVGFGPWVQEGVWKGGLDDALPTSGVVAQGPCGLEYYPGTGFGAGWKDHFLMCDFPGGIWDFTVRERGASYQLGTRRKFAWGLWPTDVEFGPDGALYIADWVFGWEKPSKGRIYRVTLSNPGDEAESRAVRQWLKEGFDHRDSPDLIALLGHADQRIRLRAQWALAKRGGASVSAFIRVLSESGGLERYPRLHAIWGLGQIGRSPAVAAGDRRAIEEALIAALRSADAEVRGLAAQQLGDLAAVSASSALLPLLQDPQPRPRLFAAIALGRLGHRSVPSELLAMIRENQDQDPFLRHGAVMALLGMVEPASLAGFQRDPSPAVRQAALLGLRRLARPEVGRFLTDPDPHLQYLAGRAINDVPIPDAMPLLASFLGKIDCPSNLLSRAINANFRVAEERNAKVLAAFANRRDVPDAMRIQALEALGDWIRPPALDRVMGLWRPLPSRTAEHARRAFRSVAASLHQVRQEPVRLAAIRTAARLGVKEVGEGYYQSMAEPGLSVALKSEILTTLATLRHTRWPEALNQGLSDPSPEVKATALRLAADQPTEQVTQLLPALLEAGNALPLRQTAFKVLGKVPGNQAVELLKQWMTRLTEGKVDSEVVLDLLEAASSHEDAELARMAKAYTTRGSDPDGLRALEPVLSGGDVSRGRALFLDKVELACLRCHRVGGNGGTVGPVLDGVGKRLQRRELLESVVHPNAKIAVGFEQAQLTLKDGGSRSGMVKKETETQIVLESLEDGEMTVAKSDIASRSRGLSAMPEGLEKLMTRQELRDLIEFLASLR